MTVRFLCAAVALAAVATEVGLAGWRAVTYRMRADDHVRYLQSARLYLYDSTELREWHERMRRKYEAAALNPWVPVERDTPPPE
jgi:hypothetical protein